MRISGAAQRGRRRLLHSLYPEGLDVSPPRYQREDMTQLRPANISPPEVLIVSSETHLIAATSNRLKSTGYALARTPRPSTT